MTTAATVDDGVLGVLTADLTAFVFDFRRPKEAVKCSKVCAPWWRIAKNSRSLPLDFEGSSAWIDWKAVYKYKYKYKYMYRYLAMHENAFLVLKTRLHPYHPMPSLPARVVFAHDGTDQVSQDLGSSTCTILELPRPCLIARFLIIDNGEFRGFNHATLKKLKEALVLYLHPGRPQIWIWIWIRHAASMANQDLNQDMDAQTQLQLQL
jgi:hypothetical protein